jgi:LmbE family N-acetylglucosaminyl deacetylase
MKKKRILVVLAHPDDESFGMGGTLAYYSSIGVDVHLICATKGEEGDLPDGFVTGNKTIAEIRQAELACAAEILGLKSVRYLGFRDSGMEGSPSNKDPRSLTSQRIEEVSKLIFRIIQEIKPQTVITFDPLGGYKHPDHIMAHRATEKSFFECREKLNNDSSSEVYSPESLYFHTFSRKMMKVFVKLLNLTGRDPGAFGKNGDIDLNSFANADFPIHVQINTGKYQRQKRQAEACHQSQGGGRFGGRIISGLINLFDRKESFMQAYPPVSSDDKIREDLFI